MRDLNHEREANKAAYERAQELGRFARWARTQDTAPVRTRMPGRQEPIGFFEWLSYLWARCDFDTRLGIVLVPVLLGLLAYAARS